MEELGRIKDQKRLKKKLAGLEQEDWVFKLQTHSKINILLKLLTSTLLGNFRAT